LWPEENVFNIVSMQTPRDSQHLKTIELFGDSVENFHNLGKIDRRNYRPLLKHIRSFMSTNWPLLNTIIDEIALNIIKHKLKGDFYYQKELEAYSEGLKLPFEELLFVYLIPEFMSSLSKWPIGIPQGLWGCSSYFYKDAKSQALHHGRILDFPLMDNFTKNERMLHLKLNGWEEMVSFSTTGLAYPALTTMTARGITLAIHQKFTNFFNPNGTPIFDLVTKLLNSADCVESAISFLEKNISLTCWGIYMGFPDGRVLAIDIAGEDVHYDIHQLDDNDILYFNNFLVQNDYPGNPLPFGYTDYCQARHDVAEMNIEKLKKKKGEKITVSDFNKLISAPHFNKKTNTKLFCGPITPSTVQICNMAPGLSSLFFFSGKTPRSICNELVQIEDIWQKPSQKISSLGKKDPLNEEYMEGLREFMLTQMTHDLKQNHQAYHHLQMCIEHWEKFPEVQLAKFYFLVLQYIHDNHKKVRSNLLISFRELEDQLPPYLNDHCLLFIFRLEKILKRKPTVDILKIKNTQMKKVYDFEKKIPSLIHGTILHKFIVPRLDSMDIIYPYVKINS
jgi:hypothetical protein